MLWFGKTDNHGKSKPQERKKPLTKDKYLEERENLGKQGKILGKTNPNPRKRLENKELGNEIFLETTTPCMRKQ